ncbi:CO(2)-response secreted protease-like [Trifolium pratense]|uniref:CO(2)-response secreted protease-like n=1 Tax=Trifolium pratense TaxID=57577 RepID=UPI001E69800A|nr:CO(2)-response secreted protease-like [Trifolium pratense]
MKVNQFLLILSFEFLFLFFGESRSLSADDGNQVYIVYMGATDSTNGSLRNDHAYVLNTVLTRNKKALVHNYKYGFSGFAARLSKDEANTIAQHPGVVSVFPNPILKLHTTRSWDFLKLQNHIKTDTTFSNSSSSSNVVIGMLDTGIWPEAENFKDNGMGPIPPGWKGTCMTSPDFNASNCNRKIIGARYYADGKTDGSKTVRDNDGHGTHTASTAAGNVVSGASYYGLATGTAKGGSPESRLAIYKVCTDGCSGATILAAFDDAIFDGVDILSLSLGGPQDLKPDLTTNVVAIGAFHAVEHGILVVCAAGNNGPWPRSVTNDAPWILTVGATTIDRNFQSNIVLGNNKVVEGEAINFSPLSKSADYPLITGESAKLPTADLEDDLEDARHCHLEALDREKVNGSIVICDGMNDTNFYYSTSLKVRVLQGMGALGLVHITDKEGAVPDNYGDFPATIVRPKDHATILQYLNSTSNPKATILPTTTVLDYKPAPMVAIFSSRGPSSLTKNIIKPDIAAPGGDILAAWTGTETDETYVPNGKLLSPYNIISGTSMSCPHVSGLAGSIKSKNPTWSPSAIKSAIMTSATQINNLKAPITTDLGPVATPYDYGAGEITTESFQPGLVYETTTMDYLNYMCYLGLNTTKIKVISKTVPKNFSCPKDSTPDYISNINYPSIAIPKFSSQGTVNVNRTVTNVGEVDETVYSATVVAPFGATVQLIPEKLQFTKSSKTLSYQVVFTSTFTSLKEDIFGSITWSNGKHSVRIPFALTV